jgi:hypothetical protein
MPIINAYHGTNAIFNKFSMDSAKIQNDYYGGGFYFTPNLEVAKIYAKSAVRKTGGKEVIYRVQLNLKKTFDVDKEYTGDELKKLIIPNFETFARSAGLLSLGKDRYAIMADLKDGNTVMTGAEVFKGMSNGMVNTAKARDHLKRLHYDSLRYNPVQHSDRIKHEVYIAYNAASVRIIGQYGSPAHEQ